MNKRPSDSGARCGLSKPVSFEAVRDFANVYSDAATSRRRSWRARQTRPPALYRPPGWRRLCGSALLSWEVTGR
jgi:hypothetical protein